MTMSSAQHKKIAEKLLSEVDPLIEAQAHVRRPLDEAQALQLAALVSYAQIQAHATLALYPDGTQPVTAVRTIR